MDELLHARASRLHPIDSELRTLSRVKGREDAPRQGPEGEAIADCGLRMEVPPNTLGLHPVTVREIDGTRVKIGPIPQPRDGTPVVDIKSASTRADE